MIINKSLSINLRSRPSNLLSPQAMRMKNRCVYWWNWQSYPVAITSWMWLAGREWSPALLRKPPIM